MRIISVVLFIFFLIACDQRSKTFRFEVSNAREEQVFKINLNESYSYQSINIKHNSLDDTCGIGVIKIPPGKTGRLYRVEFMNDSLIYHYYPYKATSGNLTFEHSFFW